MWPFSKFVVKGCNTALRDLFWRLWSHSSHWSCKLTLESFFIHVSSGSKVVLAHRCCVLTWKLFTVKHKELRFCLVKDRQHLGGGHLDLFVMLMKFTRLKALFFSSSASSGHQWEKFVLRVKIHAFIKVKHVFRELVWQKALKANLTNLCTNMKMIPHRHLAAQLFVTKPHGLVIRFTYIVFSTSFCCVIDSVIYLSLVIIFI